MKKKILITGASGQLAKSFVKLFQNKYSLNLYNKEHLDITSFHDVNQAIQKENPDIILNCAALTNVDFCEKYPEKAILINGESLENFRSFKGNFFQISTDYVFDGKSGPYTENAVTNPINIYGQSKLLGEEIVKNFNSFTILRTNILFSLFSEASFLSWVINNLKSKSNIQVVDDQYNNPISTDDCSRQISFLIENNFSGTFHSGSDLLCSRYDFALLIAKVWNLDSNLINRISTKQLMNINPNFIAERPLRSGLLSKNNEVPKYSLEKSLEDIKKNSL